MKIKIRTKIVVFSTFIYTSLLLILFMFALYDMYYATAEVYEAKLNTYMDFVEENLDELLIDLDTLDFKNFKPSEYKGSEKISVEIYDPNFTLLSKPDLNLSDEVREYFFKKDRDRICVIGEEEYCYYFELREKRIGKDTIHIASAIEWNDKDMNLKYHNFKFFIIGMVPLAILLITLISFQISKLAFKPVKNMIRDVKLIRAGNTNKRISVPKPKDEIRELGETLNKMLDSIEESMVSQKKFIENASHEIKTPLTIIRAKLELVSDGTDDNKQKNDLIELISEIDKLASLAKSLLTLARLDADSTDNSKSSVRLDELIIDVTKNYNTAAYKKNIKIVPTINEVIELLGSEEKLKSMLMNLVDNAVKYSGDGKEVKIILDKKNNSAFIEIKDNGQGISEKDLPNVFKRFYRSDEIRTEVQGSGLGLSIVEEIVKQHRGEITLTSKLGEGTKVKLEIPLA